MQLLYINRLPFFSLSEAESLVLISVQHGDLDPLDPDTSLQLCLAQRLIRPGYT